MNVSSIKKGVAAFIIVLLFMPIGHSVMILNEGILPDHKFAGAFFIGLLGVVSLVFGLRQHNRPIVSTLLGLTSGILIWTGWIEFSFVWVAQKLQVEGLMENRIVVTKPEYLIMPSSIGLLSTFLLFYLFSQNRCQFFNWFQRTINLKPLIKVTIQTYKPIAIITFMETIMILWTFYIVLLLVYDPEIAGDKHIITFLVAVGSLFWSVYLIAQLLKIKTLDYAIRYAVPTVIIFWNVIEILGRWNFLKEIWIYPQEHWLEMTITLFLLILFIVFNLHPRSSIEKKRNHHHHRGETTPNTSTSNQVE
tara:strand:+ start:14009 stop:14926 length:918 start_codon:yes stop_codon:yes gene_type:complete